LSRWAGLILQGEPSCGRRHSEPGTLAAISSGPPSPFDPVLYFAAFLGDDPYLVAAGKGLEESLANCFGVFLRGETQLRFIGAEER